MLRKVHTYNVILHTVHDIHDNMYITCTTYVHVMYVKFICMLYEHCPI